MCRKKKIEKGSVALKKHTSETEKLKKSYRFHTQKHVGKNRKIDKTLINILKTDLLRNKKIIHPPKDTCLFFFKKRSHMIILGGT